jgi:hypothetical protein
MQPPSRFNRLDDYLAGGVEDVHVLTRVRILAATYYYRSQASKYHGSK